jgi:hypothetical protein
MNEQTHHLHQQQPCALEVRLAEAEARVGVLRGDRVRDEVAAVAGLARRRGRAV